MFLRESPGIINYVVKKIKNIMFVVQLKNTINFILTFNI